MQPNKQLSSEWIPNINIGEDYDRRYVDAAIHYDALENLAIFFGRDMPVHRHAQYLQLHYIEQGAINFHIDDKLFKVSGPSLFLTPPAVPHSFQIEDDTNGHVITIHQSLIWQLLETGLPKEPALNLNEGICLAGARLCGEQSDQWQLIQQLLHNIQNEWLSEHPAKSLALESFIRLLLIQIARLSNLRTTSLSVNNDDIRLFHQFTQQIELHFKEHWRLPSYTQAIGVSESRLNHVCHRISNRSPKKIIRERVLQEIKRMLIFSNLSINEVAYDLGFADPAYFCRFFKSHAGTTPMDYRKRQLQR